MSWRAIMKSEPHTQYPQNTQNPPKKTSSEDIEDIEHRDENKKALGYGCAGCGNKIYQAVEACETEGLSAEIPWEQEHTPTVHWKCEECGSVFQYIGGSKGPQYIN
jgi:uncharacterized OB-fold protein